MADRLESQPAMLAAGGDSGRAAARAMLEAALAGVELTSTDRRFLTRLSQWDKRTAATVASLIMRARETGRDEARREAQVDVEQLAALLSVGIELSLCGTED